MTRDEALQAANQIVAESITTKDRLVQEVIADHLMRIITPLEAENRRDPHQLGDAVSTMQDALDRASEHTEIRSQDQVPNGE